jgi:hypothetical protein
MNDADVGVLAISACRYISTWDRGRAEPTVEGQGKAV